MEDQAQPLLEVNAASLTGATAAVTRTNAGMDGFRLYMTKNSAMMAFIGVAPNSSLNLSGVLLSGYQTGIYTKLDAGSDILTKTGDGTLTLSGNSANETDASFFVMDGTLVLNKQSVATLSNDFNGTIYVGDAYRSSFTANPRRMHNPISSPKTTPDALLQTFPEELPKTNMMINSTGQYQFSSALSGLASNEVQQLVFGTTAAPVTPTAAWTIQWTNAQGTLYNSNTIAPGATPFMVQQALNSMLSGINSSYQATVSGIVGLYDVTFLAAWPASKCRCSMPSTAPPPPPPPPAPRPPRSSPAARCPRRSAR